MSQYTLASSWIISQSVPTIFQVQLSGCRDFRPPLKLPRFSSAFYTHSDRACFQLMLDEANKTVATERRRNLLVMDNASWHKCKSLRWGAFEPIYLPPYSPDLNPIERLWLLIKAEWFTGFIAKDRHQLWDHLDQALCWAMDRGGKNSKTCSMKTKL